MKTWLATMAALLIAASAQAQTAAPSVWRCGADGRSYSDTPCPGGTELAVADPRSAAQTQAARDLAQRQARLASQFEREREQREKLAEARLAVPLAPHGAPPAKATKDAAKAALNKPGQKAKRRPPADDGIWRAVVPASRQG